MWAVEASANSFERASTHAQCCRIVSAHHVKTPHVVIRLCKQPCATAPTLRGTWVLDQRAQTVGHPGAWRGVGPQTEPATSRRGRYGGGAVTTRTAPRDHGARHPKRSAWLLRKGPAVKYGFIARHHNAWPTRTIYRVWRSPTAASANGWAERRASAPRGALRRCCLTTGVCAQRLGCTRANLTSFGYAISISPADDRVRITVSASLACSKAAWFRFLSEWRVTLELCVASPFCLPSRPCPLTCSGCGYLLPCGHSGLAPARLVCTSGLAPTAAPSAPAAAIPLIVTSGSAIVTGRGAALMGSLPGLVCPHRSRLGS